MEKSSGGILLDSDVISHFFATNNQELLAEILGDYLIIIVDQVYYEATHNPRFQDRKQEIDEWIERNKISIISFPSDVTSQVVMEYFRLEEEYKLMGKGERACLAVAQFYNDTIASSNFRDVKQYCDEHGLVYIGTLDILYIGIQKNLLTIEKANEFIEGAKYINGAYFPVSKIDNYKPSKDIVEFI